LPATPLLCLNTTLLNNAKTGRFSQTGYSSEGVGERGPTGSYPEHHVDGVSIGFATAASAAFPFGLPPLSIASDRFKAPVDPRLGKRLLFTDGGILENLGVERLLKSQRFGTDHILVSDAAVQDLPWQPAGLMAKVRSGLIYTLSAPILERLLSIMNNKQNATMRALLFAELADRLASKRSFVYVRLAQTWSGLIKPEQEAKVVYARQLYDEMGGDRAANAASTVSTSFTGLSSETLDLLEAHARWQTHAMIQLYGKDLLPASGT
jgi:predicted acylesterase/phospholipase RssA